MTSARRKPSPAQNKPSPAQKWTVLVVDDDPAVCASLRSVLEKEGYSVLEASSGPEGLEIAMHRPIHVVISDHSMPLMSGVDMLKLMRVRHPHVLRILLTASPDPETPVRSINESEVYRFIRKPWNTWELRTILHFAFEVVRLQDENRRLLELAKTQRKVRARISESDPVGLEKELELLAKAESELLDG